jgi:NDP-sugar pyrophosphorylase family protein
VGQRFSIEYDIFPELAALKNLTYSLLKGSLVDIGIPKDYFAFCEKMANLK